MRTVLVLLIAIALIVLQYQLGLRKKVILGSILPVAFLTFSIWMIVVDKAGNYVALLSPTAAFIAIWLKGYLKSQEEERRSIELMKVKDL